MAGPGCSCVLCCEDQSGGVGAGSVTEAFVCRLGRSWWSMHEEGHRHVQAKIYTVERKKKATAPKHLLLTFQIGLGLYIHLCQQISLL